MVEARRPCPDAALLAAFLDETLAEYERTAVVTHLAECEGCRSVALAVVEFREVEALDNLWTAERTPPQEVRRITRVGRSTREKTPVAAPIAAGVAIIALLALPLRSHSAVESAEHALSRMFVVAAGQRPVEARLAGDAIVTSTHSSSRTSATWGLVQVADRVRDNYADSYDVPSRRAVGVAALITSDLDTAVSSLAMAAVAAPDDAHVANDLAAAYFERAQRLDRPEDLPAALNEAERALRLDSSSLPARFNRALIVSALGLGDAARGAWGEYLRNDATSPWAIEARQRLDAIDRPMTDDGWDTLRRTLAASLTAQAAATIVERGHSRVREWFEGDLLREWTAGLSAGEVRTTLRQMRMVAEALEARTGDRFFVDVVTSLDVVSGDRARHSLAAATYRDLLAGLQLVKDRNPQEATVALQRALPRLRQLDSPESLTARIELAATSVLQGRYVDAAHAAGLLKEEARRRQYHHLTARAAWMEGLAYVNLANLTAARVALEDMLAAANTTGDAEHYANASLNLGNLYDLLGDNHQAWRHRIAAAERLRLCHVPVTHINLLMAASGHAIAAEYFGTASVFQDYLSQSRLPLPIVLEIQFRTQRAIVLGHLNQLAAATAELKRARELMSEVTLPETHARLEADVFAAHAELLQPHQPGEALAVAEAGLALATPATDMFRKSRLLLRVADAALASGRLARADEAIGAGIAALQTYRSVPAAESSLVVASDHDIALYTKAMQMAIERGDMAHAFEYSERRRIRMTTPAAATASLQDVQRTLPSDGAILIFNHLDDVLHIWSIRQDGMATYAAQVDRSRVASLVLAHLDEIGRQSIRPLKSAELYDLLFKPMADSLRGVHSIAIIADAQFTHVAFAGLWDAQRDRFLVEDYRLFSPTTATSTSPQVMTAQSEAPSDRFGIVQAFDRSAHVESRRDLYTTDLSRLYGHTDVRRGEAATPSRILRQLSERDVVHIAAPLIADRDDPARWRLVVADEPGRRYSGSVSSADLTQARVRTRLVTFDPEFSERVSSSGGVQSVARALMAAGVPDVVGPVVSLPSATYDDIWLEFHRRYLAGWSAVDSLRGVQLGALADANRRLGSWATLTVFSRTK